MFGGETDAKDAASTHDYDGKDDMWMDGYSIHEARSIPFSRRF